MSSAEQCPSAFADSGEDAIARSIDVTSSPSARRPESSSIAEFYEIERTAETILKGDFKRVALQFPDELLHDAVPVYRLLKECVGQERDLYVLADTSYGNCCVDEVAAQHVDADLIVHYGHACMSKTSRLPVVYVFGHKPMNVEDCIQELSKLLEDLPNADDKTTNSVLIRHDVGYTYRIGDIVERLRDKTGLPVLFHEIPTWVEPASVPPPLLSNNETKQLSDGDSKIGQAAKIILYIGEESLTLTNLLMIHSSSIIYSYNPNTKHPRLESERTNRLLMRRFAAVQKARDADVFGILVGTLGVASYLPLISHLRDILKKAQKKSYTISVGKLNPAKLGNFMEIECFVLAACPENSVIESKEFHRPIITPYELEVALQPEGTWSGHYVLDFSQILDEYDPDKDALRDEKEEDKDPDRPTFSLVTGKYRHPKRFGAPESLDEGTSPPNALVLRNQDGTVTVLPESAAALYLNSRSFRGLEARVGEDEPSILEQGRSGIARGYTDDHP